MNATRTTQGTFIFGEAIAVLKGVYEQTVLPLEKQVFLDNTFAPLTDEDFFPKPVVLVLGEQQVGKTSLIQRYFPEYPGSADASCHFNVVLDSKATRPEGIQVMEGIEAVGDSEMPLTGARRLSKTFHDRLQGIKTDGLEGVVFVDTPGLLGDGSLTPFEGTSDGEGIFRWFAARSDVIAVVCDVKQLKPSDAFKRILKTTRGYESKMIVVMNKVDDAAAADLRSCRETLRLYLGEVMTLPDDERFFINPVAGARTPSWKTTDFLLGEEANLDEFLQNSVVELCSRQLNRMYDRARRVKVHACILAHLRMKLQRSWWKENAKEEFIANLTREYKEIAQDKVLSLGDFLDHILVQDTLRQWPLELIERVDTSGLVDLDHALIVIMPNLMLRLPVKEPAFPEVPHHDSQRKRNTTRSTAAVLDGDTGHFEVSPTLHACLFNQLVTDGNGNRRSDLRGIDVKMHWEMSGLSHQTLHRIWALASSARPKDDFSPYAGRLNLWQFSVAETLIKARTHHHIELPEQLPLCMIPSWEDLRAHGVAFADVMMHSSTSSPDMIPTCSVFDFVSNSSWDVRGLPTESWDTFENQTSTTSVPVSANQSTTSVHELSHRRHSLSLPLWQSQPKDWQLREGQGSFTRSALAGTIPKATD